MSLKHPLAEITPSHDFQTLETTSSNDFMSDTVASVWCVRREVRSATKSLK